MPIRKIAVLQFNDIGPGAWRNNTCRMWYSRSNYTVDFNPRNVHDIIMKNGPTRGVEKLAVFIDDKLVEFFENTTCDDVAHAVDKLFNA